jgi:hypothetical protein
VAEAHGFAAAVVAEVAAAGGICVEWVEAASVVGVAVVEMAQVVTPGVPAADLVAGSLAAETTGADHPCMAASGEGVVAVEDTDIEVRVASHVAYLVACFLDSEGCRWQGAA